MTIKREGKIVSISMRHLAISLTGALGLLMAGCATPDTSSDLADREYTVVETGSEATRTTRDAVPVSADEEDPVVCKKVYVTGSRFGTRTCAKKSEWEETQDGSEEFLRNHERRTRVGRPGG